LEQQKLLEKNPGLGLRGYDKLANEQSESANFREIKSFLNPDI